MRETRLGGAPLTKQPPPDKTAIAKAYLSNLIDLAYKADVNVEGEDQACLSAWLGIEDEQGRQG